MHDLFTYCSRAFKEQGTRSYLLHIVSLELLLKEGLKREGGREEKLADLGEVDFLEGVLQ